MKRKKVLIQRLYQFFIPARETAISAVDLEAAKEERVKSVTARYVCYGLLNAFL